MLTKCRTICVPILGRKCKERKKKACECGAYAAISPALEDACIKQYANSGTFKTLAAWECANSELIFNKTGNIVCQFDPNTSWVAQQKNNAQSSIDNAAKTQQMILIGVLLFFLAGILFFLLPSKKRSH